ncbi:maleylpyruvate isomerase family mycothiol-dependent enzyme [Cryptosporangium phraense]|uniref:Maleylpyruvate isomerase family mycothiol-dependent enzyme n=1 Tax=Cryptosporangium phraense TaxID=2593070 RepID=A0A545AJ17_9ACTN|nr:maleylpyruvate isomerase family mycothiol-dependent enzyme [Cryptosporangium phraense]TQS41317.1 maleylpyruvate isomerase family mycothiol-dependent enzyme [Cryptosporangium phraense]
MSAPDVETPISALARIDHAEAMDLTVTEHDRFYTLLDGLAPDEWARATDCQGWDVRAIAVHVLGSARAQASVRELVRQVRAGRRSGQKRWRDRANAAQLAEGAALKPDALPDLWAVASYQALHARQRIPGPVRALPLLPLGTVDGVKFGWKPVEYLYGIGFTRSVWMHRLDITGATGREPHTTPEHDGRIVADLVAEWAGTHSEPFTLRLTGPAGGKFVRDPDHPGEVVERDAVEFARILTGRSPGEGVLRHPLPLV